MTKAEYLEWLKTRGEAGTWDHEKCRAADHLIEQETLENLENYLQKIGDKPLQEFVMVMARSQFGCVETDEFLTKINAYPDWIDGEKAEATSLASA